MGRGKDFNHKKKGHELTISKKDSPSLQNILKMSNMQLNLLQVKENVLSPFRKLVKLMNRSCRPAQV
ncbi:hypothetical protein MGI18_18860 [Bacillus sp. OVS6]|nr:hypothetical protein MGI18_18860 [Bacillus sp. OVS6]